MTSSDSTRRSDCPISFGLDIFGDKWTLLVLRDLLLKGKRHYRELQACEEGIATNILADRLKRLESNGIVRRETDPDDRRQAIYRVTAKGLTLMPVLVEIAAWGARHDARTGAPAEFLEAYNNDRAAMITRLMEDVET